MILGLWIGCSANAQQPISALQRYEFYGQAQGTGYTITYYHKSPIITQISIDSIFEVIDKSMSLYRADSKISAFNLSSTNQIDLDPHMQKVLKRAFQVNKESKGLFDITVKPLVFLWGFGPEKTVGIPDSSSILQTLQLIGMNKLKMSANKLIKKSSGMQIDLNGIAQGYTVDVLADFLKSKAVKSFIVEVGGEIRAEGYKPGKERYKVLLQRPEQAQGVKESIIELKNMAITTSGSYEKFRTVKNYRFSHHMDPKTGYPLKSNIISVSVISKKAMDADAYDNVFMAMKPLDAIAFANKKNKMDIYLIYLDEGVVKEAYSKGFKKYLISN